MASARLHDNGFDAEIWDVDGELWCVRRPRTLTVSAMALWFTFGGFALASAVACALLVVLAGERGGVVAWTVVGGGFGLFAMHRGWLAVRADRAVKALPLAALPHLVIERDRRHLRDSDGELTPLAEVTVTQGTDEVGDSTHHELTVSWTDRARKARAAVIFCTGRAARLDPAIETLRRAGLRLTRPPRS